MRNGQMYEELKNMLSAHEKAEERAIRVYCKENGLDYNNAFDYRHAACVMYKNFAPHVNLFKSFINNLQNEEYEKNNESPVQKAKKKLLDVAMYYFSQQLKRINHRYENCKENVKKEARNELKMMKTAIDANPALDKKFKEKIKVKAKEKMDRKVKEGISSCGAQAADEARAVINTFVAMSRNDTLKGLSTDITYKKTFKLMKTKIKDIVQKEDIFEDYQRFFDFL